MTAMILSEARIQEEIKKMIADETTVRRLAQKAVTEAEDEMRQRIARSEMIDRIIERVIPRQYSGYGRNRMKGRIRKYLREKYKI